MISFAAANRLHDLSQRCIVNYHHVENPRFRRYCQEARHFLALVGDAALDDEWLDLTRTLKRYRFDHAAAPLAFNDPEAAPRLGPDALRRAVALTKVTYPHLADPMGSTIDLLLALSVSGDNPLLGPFESLVRSSDAGNTALMLAESRLVEPTRVALASHSWARGLDVVTAAAVRGPQRYERLILIGNAQWFPDHVFSAPRVAEIDMITYAWLSGKWYPAPAFLATGADISVPRVVPNTTIYESDGADHGSNDADTDSDDIGPGLDWASIERRWASSKAETSETADLVEARLYSLDGGEAVFLDATGRETIMTIDLGADDRSRVRQVVTREVVPGMYIVLRTNDHGNYVVAVADRLLGDRRDAYRAAQARWKQMLRDHVLPHGLLKTSVDLLDLGSERAEEVNVRYWMSARNIGTRDRCDFAAIMALIGLGGETDWYWQITRALRGAHLRAGATIRKRLLSLVRAADALELERRGRLVFELPEAEGGRLTAFRVEGRSASMVLIQASRIERPFRRED